MEAGVWKSETRKRGPRSARRQKNAVSKPTRVMEANRAWPPLCHLHKHDYQHARAAEYAGAACPGAITIADNDNDNDRHQTRNKACNTSDSYRSYYSNCRQMTTQASRKMRSKNCTSGNDHSNKKGSKRGSKRGSKKGSKKSTKTSANKDNKKASTNKNKGMGVTKEGNGNCKQVKHQNQHQHQQEKQKQKQKQKQQSKQGGAAAPASKKSKSDSSATVQSIAGTLGAQHNTTNSGDMLTSCLKAVKTTMLSVGSGDGSQQKAMVEAGLNQLVVTFYDSRPQLLRKYPNAVSILEYLEQHCNTPPLYQVDATRLAQLLPTVPTEPSTELPQRQSFDLIFFTFPHTGEKQNQDTLQKSIRSNQELLRKFLQSAARVVTPGTGEIQITLKNGQPYDQWMTPELIGSDLLDLVSVQAFHTEMFPEYHHRMTAGNVCYSKGIISEVKHPNGASVYIFKTKQQGPAMSAATSAHPQAPATTNPTGGSSGALSQHLPAILPQAHQQAHQRDTHNSAATQDCQEPFSDEGGDIVTFRSAQHNPAIETAQASPPVHQRGLECSLGHQTSPLVHDAHIITTPAPLIPAVSAAPSTTQPTRILWTDEQLATQINPILQQCHPEGMTVLDIRRLMPQPTPDPKQLNRVLYGLEREGVIQHKDYDATTMQGGSRKPRWCKRA